MFDWRNLVIGAFAFSLTFAAAWWLGLGRTTLAVPVAGTQQSAIQTRPAEAPQALALTPVKTQPQPPMGKGLTENDGLRQAVILRSKAYQRPTCNHDPKSLYIAAATKYAEVLMRAAGCNNFPKCPMSMGALDDVWQRNRSVADAPVAEAMAAVNAAGGLSEKDFRGDVGRAVRVIAGSDFHSGPAPVCEAANSRGSTVRIRIRR